ncbi:unnamed protein product [[Candida] boidinii]|uniref:Unnamed protein product n=1 Tax=Candida boidinii TaxID=5477 RepID=A0A9W6SSY7_CANBO|nr:hypothetical protein B5S33_g4084 [[Candida] boidinii]GME66681.1 unnamed protein product [[Candida] boidinii]GMF99336.1 unnamed protein product [[Candida] boidinii]
MNHIAEYGTSSSEDDDDHTGAKPMNDTNSNNFLLDDPPIDLQLRFSKTPAFFKKNNAHTSVNSITSFIYIPVEFNTIQYELITIYNNYVSQLLRKHMNEFKYGANNNGDDYCLYADNIKMNSYSNDQELHISLCYNFTIKLEKIDEFKEQLINITDTHLKNLKEIKFKPEITLIPNTLTIINKDEYACDESYRDDRYDKIFIALKLTDESQFRLKDFISAVNDLIQSSCGRSQGLAPVQPYDFQQLHCSIGEIDIDTRRAATLQYTDRLFFHLHEFLETFPGGVPPPPLWPPPLTGAHAAGEMSVAPDAVMMTEGRKLFRAALQKKE